MRTEDDLRAAFLARSERYAPEAARLLPGARSGRLARRRKARGGILSPEHRRAAAHTRTALAGGVRPLDLPAVPDKAAKARGWVTWAAPVAAAAVVIALGISLAFARHVAGKGAATLTSPGISATLPEYYAALDDPSGPGPGAHQVPVSIRIGDDRTGKIVATVNPPAGETFAGLTAGADDRTFVAAAVRFPVKSEYQNAVAWYLLRLTPGSTHPVMLTQLPILGEPAGTLVSAIALSPNGTELAVMSQSNPGSGKSSPLTVRLYSLATGKPVRTWTEATKTIAVPGEFAQQYSSTALTWLVGGRTLAISYGFTTSLPRENAAGSVTGGGNVSNVTVRRVDVGSPSGDLLARSKLVFRLNLNVATSCFSLQLTADGKTVLCGEVTAGSLVKRSTAYAPKIVAYSVATARPRLLYQLKGAYKNAEASVLWASPTGSTLLGWLDGHAGSGMGVQAVGLIAKSSFKPVRFPSALAFGVIVF